MKRRLWASAGFGLFLCLASARTIEAQVSCSAAVRTLTCQETAKLLNGFLILEKPEGPHRSSITLELLSPVEYQDRVGQITRRAPDKIPVGCGGVSYKLVFNNCYDDNVLFLRRKSVVLPVHILVSTDEVELEGKTSVPGILCLYAFIRGYFEGLMAVYSYEDCENPSSLRLGCGEQ